jgi:hypothetical protein
VVADNIQNRKKLISLSPLNAEYFSVIEKSAFVISLDDSEPNTPSERIKNTYIGNGFNRWNDKCQQYIIPKNGDSAQIFEHSLIDGVTVLRLNLLVQEAINNYQPSPGSYSNGYSEVNLNEYKLEIPADIDSHIVELRRQFIAATDLKDFRYLTVPGLGNNKLMGHKMPIKGSIDLTIQLASRIYFGYSPAAWEPINMSQFHRGRPEVVQVVLKSVIKFVDSCLDSSVSDAGRLALMLSAAKDMSAYLRRASEGKNYFRLMDVLEVMGPRSEEEGRPKLFDDPVWKRVAPGLSIMTNFHIDLLKEAAYNMPTPTSIWNQYTVRDDEFVMSSVGPSNDLERWEEAVQKAAKIVKQVIEAK